MFPSSPLSIIAVALQAFTQIIASIATFGYYVDFVPSTTVGYIDTGSSSLWGAGHSYPAAVKAVKSLLLIGFLAACFASVIAAVVFFKVFYHDHYDPLIDLGKQALLLNISAAFCYTTSAIIWAIWAGNQPSKNKLYKYYAVAGWISR